LVIYILIFKVDAIFNITLVFNSLSKLIKRIETITLPIPPIV